MEDKNAKRLREICEEVERLEKSFVWKPPIITNEDRKELGVLKNRTASNPDDTP